MNAPAFIDSPLYAWGLLPFLIFLSRVIDVSMGTVRVIFVSRGMKYLAPLVGFLEVLVWLLAVGQVMPISPTPFAISPTPAASPWATTSASASPSGCPGPWLIRVITGWMPPTSSSFSGAPNYGVTCVDAGQDRPGEDYLHHRSAQELSGVVEIIKRFNPQAFYSIEEINSVQSGVFPLRDGPEGNLFTRLFRPMRKASNLAAGSRLLQTKRKRRPIAARTYSMSFSSFRAAETPCQRLSFSMARAISARRASTGAGSVVN